MWYERSGPRAVLTWALALTALGALCIWGAPGPVTFIAALILFAFANGLGFAVNPVVSRLYGADRARGLSLLHSTQGVGRLLAPLLVSACIAVTHGWRAAFVVSAVLSGIWAWLFHHNLRDTAAGPGDAPAGRFAWRSVTQHLRNKPVLLGLIGIAFGSGCEVTFITWTPAFLETEAGLPKAEALYSLTAMMIGYTAVRLLLGAVHVGDRRAFIIGGLALNLASCTVLITARTTQTACAAALLLGLSFGAYWPSMAARVFSRVPGGHGMVGGLLVAASAAGTMIMLTVAGWLGEISLTLAFAVASLAAVAYTVTSLAMASPARTDG